MNLHAPGRHHHHHTRLHIPKWLPIFFIFIFIAHVLFVEWSGEVRSITYSADAKSVSVVYRVTLYGTDAEVQQYSYFHLFSSNLLIFIVLEIINSQLSKQSRIFHYMYSVLCICIFYLKMNEWDAMNYHFFSVNLEFSCPKMGKPHWFGSIFCDLGVHQKTYTTVS